MERLYFDTEKELCSELAEEWDSKLKNFTVKHTDLLKESDYESKLLELKSAVTLKIQITEISQFVRKLAQSIYSDKQISNSKNGRPGPDVLLRSV